MIEQMTNINKFKTPTVFFALLLHENETQRVPTHPLVPGAHITTSDRAVLFDCAWKFGLPGLGAVGGWWKAEDVS